MIIQYTQRYVFCLLILIHSIHITFSKTTYLEKRILSAQQKKQLGIKNPSHYIKEIIPDALLFHKNLLSLDTLKVCAGTIPAFLIARHCDDTIQNNFYDKHHHKNICQLPNWTHQIARFITGPTIIFLSLQGFLSKKNQDNYTAYTMVLGLPFLWYTNEIIKKIKMDCSLRPWHEDFSCHKRTPGGFPSNHTAKISYLATLYGLQYGYKAGIPLGLIALGIGSVFIASNRHYTSQIIAGAGFGIAYGIAAHKLVQKKLDNIEINFFYSPYQGSSLQIAWQF